MMHFGFESASYGETMRRFPSVFFLSLFFPLFSSGLFHKSHAEARRASAAENFPAEETGEPRDAVLEITHPFDRAAFPKNIAPPTIHWKDAGNADAWTVSIGADGDGDEIQSGPLHRRQWMPAVDQWRTIQRFSLENYVSLRVVGFQRERPKKILSSAQISFRTSADEVDGAIFYREVNLPFAEAVKDPTLIRWRLGSVSETRAPATVLERLPVCGNCHSFSADGKTLGMDVDYANDKGSYALTTVSERIVLDEKKIITWSDYRREDGERTYGLLSQVSPNGRYVVGTVKDRSVFLAKPDLEYSQLFFPVKGILAIYDRETKQFRALPGADDPRFVQSNPAWSPDGEEIVFARAKAFQSESAERDVLLNNEEWLKFVFLTGGRRFAFDLYRVPFNEGKGGKSEPVVGASHNGASNYFPKFSPDGKWIVFCKAESYMLLQPNAELHIIPAGGGEARRLNCNARRMNSWHSWSPNGRWLVFSSKHFGPYTQLLLAHVDEEGRAAPPVWLERFIAPQYAANIPEFVPFAPDALKEIRENFVNCASMIRAGDAFLHAGDVENARDAFRQALALNPESADALYHLGFVLCLTKQEEEGVELLRKATKLNPTMPNLHVSLGSAYERLERFDDAAFHFSEATKTDAGNVKLFLATARCLTAAGKATEALALWRKATEVAPESPLAQCRYGAALYENGQIASGIERLKKALALDANFSEAHLRWGIALLKRGEFDESLARCREALRLDPQNPEILSAIADCFAALNDRQREFEHRLGALQLDPERPELCLALAKTLIQKDEFKRAQNHLLRAAAQKRLRPNVARELIWLFATYPEAEIRNAEQAVRLGEQIKEKNFLVLDALAAAYAEAGRFEEATATAAKALRLAENERVESVPDIKERLKCYRDKKPWRLNENRE
jgi:Flp pilus assembly protein TadD